jgi:uncharacterized membrane protein YkvA (DUF1232 family)
VTTRATQGRGRGRGRLAAAASARARREVPIDDLAEDVTPKIPRSGAKRTLMGTMRQLPNFLRMLYGLLTDSRVATTDKLLVGGAILYVLMPLDLIPDFIPFIGEVDDIFVVVLALQRLISHAGRSVVRDHWMGDPEDLSSLNLEKILAAAAFFLPRRIRRRLRTIGREV